MVNEDITPASKTEMEQWENDPDRIFETPHIKYMRSLHPVLRSFITENWDTIKTFKTDRFIKRSNFKSLLKIKQ